MLISCRPCSYLVGLAHILSTLLISCRPCSYLVGLAHILSALLISCRPCSYLVGLVHILSALLISCRPCSYLVGLAHICGRWPILIIQFAVVVTTWLPQFILMLHPKYWAYNTTYHRQRSQSFVGRRRNLSRIRSRLVRVSVFVKQSACCFLVGMCLTRRKPSA